MLAGLHNSCWIVLLAALLVGIANGQSNDTAWTLADAPVQEAAIAPDEVPLTTASLDSLSLLAGRFLFVPSADLLPPAPDPGNLFWDEVKRTTSFGPAISERVVGVGADFRWASNVVLDLKYESGVGIFPNSVALHGTDAARAAGRFSMSALSSSLGFDLQTGSSTQPAVRGGGLRSGLQAQGFLDFDFAPRGERAAEASPDEQLVEGTLRVKSAYGRADLSPTVRTATQISLLGGRYFQTWGDTRAIPKSIQSTVAPAGSFSPTELPQLRLVLARGNLSSTVAIEDQTPNDFTPLDSRDVVLDRVPDFVINLRYDRPRSGQDFDAIQVAGLVRTFGFEDIAGREHFVNGVGGSVIARFITNYQTLSNCRLGVMGGRGIGSYIYGLNGTRSAAGPQGPLLKPLDNLGAFASYQHRWCDSQGRNDRWGMNFAYGYVLSENTPLMSATAPRKAQNGWINIIHRLNDNMALGLEYYYVTRRVRDGSTGDNHQIVLGIQWSPKILQSGAVRLAPVSMLDTAPLDQPPIRFDGPSNYKTL